MESSVGPLKLSIFSFRQGPETWQTWFLLHILVLYVTKLQTRYVCEDPCGTGRHLVVLHWVKPMVRLCFYKDNVIGDHPERQ